MAATRIPGPHLSNGSAQAQQPKVQQNELEILNPGREVTLGGKLYTVREYGHVEWLKLLEKIEPVVEILQGRFTKNNVTKLPTGQALFLVSEYHEVMLPIIKQSAGISEEEFNALEMLDLEILIATWWGVNFRFFSQRVISRQALIRWEQEEKEKEQSHSQKSMAP